MIWLITISSKGGFSNTDTFFKNITKKSYLNILDTYGKQGVNALSSHTPKDSGKTSTSWGYKIENKNGTASIIWNNSNIINGVPIAIIIQYGHATGNGGYVQGIDYINKALKPIFDEISNNVWKEVTKI